ncbi:MAG TPA: (Fe-S)-binding protein [Blastocatellia bacterium]|nr:(Fe-S)-binding protein [Blastocatellia bacterium]
MKASLFVTCVVDQMFPRVGLAMAELLTRLGVEITFNAEQTCCGQPAFNTGYREEAREVARHMLDVFERELETSDYIVAPSGSCVTMVRKFYVELFADDDKDRLRAERVAARTFELSEFLVRVLGIEDTSASYDGRVTYHDSCHLLRELGIASEPRRLIQQVRGAELVEMDRADACCGFGGTFSVRFPEISTAIAEEKIASIERSGADTIVACDSSCLMQIAGLLARRGSNVRCLHIAELLANKL